MVILAYQNSETANTTEVFSSEKSFRSAELAIETWIREIQLVASEKKVVTPQICIIEDTEKPAT